MSGISRRGFLATTALLGGSAALAATGCSGKNLEPTDSSQPAAIEEKFITTCRGNCMGGCPMEATVRDGKLVSITAAEVPFPEYKRICQRGRTHIQTVYNEKRIQYPMRRVDGTARGAGEWERVSWDEAVNEICTKWKGYQQEFGPQSIGFSFASGNYGIAYGVALNTLGYMAKLLNCMNATLIHHCYDNAFGRFIQTTGILTAALFPHQMKDSQTIVVWGANPTESAVHLNHFILEAQQRGAKLVVIDPNYTIMASKADLWIPIRPGTDGALALTLVKTAIDSGVADQDSLKNHNTFPFLVKDADGEVLMLSDMAIPETNTQDKAADEPMVMASDGTLKRASECTDPQLSGVTEANGIPVHTIFDMVMGNIAQWTPELCHKITDVDEATQQQLLDLLVGNKPATMVVGLGQDHYENGYMTYTNMGLLSSVTGNLGLAGGGMDQYVMAALDFYCNIPTFMPTGPSQSPQIIFTALDHVMETGQFNGNPVNLKSIFFAYHNALTNSVNYNRIIETLDKVEFIVTCDIVMTDTCRYSDIVLPAAHWFEFEEVHSMYSPFVVHCDKVLDPAFESKNCYDTVQLLAKGMGLSDLFAESNEDVLASATNSEVWGMFGINWETLKENRIMGLMGADGGCMTGNNYSRPDQRVNFYFGDKTDPQYYNSYYDMGQEVDWGKLSLPYWEPPYEAWPETIEGFKATDAAKKYPLVYTSYRNKFKCHTQFGYNSWLHEIDPEPYVMLSPTDAETRQIKDGDVVRVFNDRGGCKLKAIINPGVRAGVIVIPKGWQIDQYIEGSAAELTSNHMNPVCFNSYFFDALCDVELCGKDGE